MELDGILPDSLGGRRPGRGLEHWQSSGLWLGGISGLAMRLFPLFIAEGAWARVSKENKGIMGLMAIIPDDVHPRTGGQVHLYGFRLCICHLSSIARDAEP